MMDVDVAKVAEVVRRVAKEIVMPKYHCLSNDEIMTKACTDDFVTVADLEAEREITKGLNELYPHAVVIGEESIFQNPSLLDVLKGDAPVFVIDPIDGTRSFKDGGKNFGIMVAYAIKGEIRSGVIYIPLADKMTMGEIGSGVYINGVRQQIRERTTVLSEMVGVADYTTQCFDDHVKDIYWTRSAALAYIDFIENKADFISFISRELKPWDHMAGLMLAKEAGAYIKVLPDKDYDYREYTEYLIVSATERNFKSLKKLTDELFKETP